MANENNKPERVEKYNYGRKPPKEYVDPSTDDLQISSDTEQLLALADFYINHETPSADSLSQHQNTSSIEITGDVKNTPPDNKETSAKQSAKAPKSKTTSSQKNNKKGGSKKKSQSGKTSSNKKSQSNSNSETKKKAPTQKIPNISDAAPIIQEQETANKIAHEVQASTVSSMPELTRSDDRKDQSRSISNEQPHTNNYVASADKLDLHTEKKAPAATKQSTTVKQTHRKQPVKQQNEHDDNVISWEEEEKLRILAAERDGTITGLIMMFVMGVSWWIYSWIANYIPEIAPEVLAGNVTEKLLQWLFSIIVGMGA